MSDFPSSPEVFPVQDAAASPVPPTASAASAEPIPAQASDASRRRGGRSASRAQGGKASVQAVGTEARAAASSDQDATARGRPGRQFARRQTQRSREDDASAPRGVRSHPLMAVLGQLHPALFGEHPLPLKRGIFQDLVARHGEQLPEADLKVALGLYTRSTRYLTAVAAGLPRHDLDDQPVETMAPEHVHHALLEVFKRRQQRTQEDLAPKLRRRLAQAFEASGLSRDDYALLVRNRDESLNQLLDEALSEAATNAARDEALLRAYEASGLSVPAFAEAYGRDPRQVQRTVDNATRRRQKTI